MRTYLRRWCVRIIPIGGVVAENEPILSRRNAEGTRVSAEASMQQWIVSTIIIIIV